MGILTTSEIGGFLKYNLDLFDGNNQLILSYLDSITEPDSMDTINFCINDNTNVVKQMRLIISKLMSGRINQDKDGETYQVVVLNLLSIEYRI